MPAQILQITSVADLFGQQVLNRWHFLDPTGTADPAPVLPAFVTDVITPYKNWAVSAMQFHMLLYRIITDPLSSQQEYAINPVIVGASPTPGEPSYVAATVRWNFSATQVLTPETPQRRIRRGGKRLAGVAEGTVVNNYFQLTILPFIELIPEGYLGMSVGGFVPIIAGFPVQPPKGVDRDDPTLQVPNKYAPITGFVVNQYAGTQVSRKVGHGR